jgi:murein DD-endopeptidase MepM/ murein hydrolase activator NlpD
MAYRIFNHMHELILQELRASSFHPVLPFIPGKDRLVELDLSVNNEMLTDELLSDTQNFSHYIQQQLQTAGAKYGIGGYGEHRKVYGNSRVFDASTPGEEPRRLHLGIDIWSKPYTAVMAPLDGIVHSFAFNNQQGDYGATIILVHHLVQTHIYTLYGHLSLSSLKDLREGDRYEKGDIIGELGIPYENGGWPPHLHFQIILDINGWKGDYPGVCKLSEKENWLANCPDPEIILQWRQYL